MKFNDVNAKPGWIGYYVIRYFDVIAEPDLDISTEWHPETVLGFPY